MNEAVGDFSSKDTTNVEEAWQGFKLRVLHASERTLGFVRRKHQDWFDDNDPEIQTMLDQMHRQHIAWINDKNSMSKKSTYQRTKQLVQARLHSMKDSWWRQKADELQLAADRKDSKSFFEVWKLCLAQNPPARHQSTAVTGRESRN